MIRAASSVPTLLLLVVQFAPASTRAQTVGAGAAAATCVPWMEEGAPDALDTDFDYTNGGSYIDVASGVEDDWEDLFCPLALEDGQSYTTMRMWAYDADDHMDIQAIGYKFDRTTGDTSYIDVTGDICALTTSNGYRAQSTHDSTHTADTGTI